TSLERVVEELARALNAFSECGLRHRDLRAQAVLIRALDPLDLVVTNFGSARLSEFDLDIVSPLESTRYTAPEALAGGVAASSDWWSMGMILLELVTNGACFEGIHEQAFLIHVLANGAPLPPNLDPRTDLLLRGLLARDRRQRWTWNEVHRWLDGEAPSAPESAESRPPHSESTRSIILAGRGYTNPKAFALAAAEESQWEAARALLGRGAIATWAEEAALGPRVLAGVRQAQTMDRVSEDFRLSLALRALNPVMPLVWRGEIVAPGWLLQHPEEGVALIEGPVPDILARTDSDLWLCGLKKRSETVRQRASLLEIPIDEEVFRIQALSTSRPRLAALWEARSRLFPDTDHPGLISILERRQK